MSIMLLMDDMGLDLSSIEIYSSDEKGRVKRSGVFDIRVEIPTLGFRSFEFFSFFADRLFQ